MFILTEPGNIVSLFRTERIEVCSTPEGFRITAEWPTSAIAFGRFETREEAEQVLYQIFLSISGHHKAVSLGRLIAQAQKKQRAASEPEECVATDTLLPDTSETAAAVQAAAE